MSECSDHIRHRDFVGQVQLAVCVIGAAVERYVAAPRIGGGGIEKPRRRGLVTEGETTGGSTATGPDGQWEKVRRVVAYGNSGRANKECAECAPRGGTRSEKTQLSRNAQILNATYVVEDALTGVCPDVGDRSHQAQPISNSVSADQRHALLRQRADVPVGSFQRAFPVLIPAVVARKQRRR